MPTQEIGWTEAWIQPVHRAGLQRMRQVGKLRSVAYEKYLPKACFEAPNFWTGGGPCCADAHLAALEYAGHEKANIFWPEQMRCWGAHREVVANLQHTACAD